MLGLFRSNTSVQVNINQRRIWPCRVFSQLCENNLDYVFAVGVHVTGSNAAEPLTARHVSDSSGSFIGI